MRRIGLTIILIVCFCASADARVNWHRLNFRSRYDPCGGYIGGSGGVNWNHFRTGFSGYGGGYGRRYDRDLNRVMNVGGLALGAYQVASNSRQQNRVLTMAEQQQLFYMQQMQQQPVQPAPQAPSQRELELLFKQQQLEFRIKALEEELKKRN